MKVRTLLALLTLIAAAGPSAAQTSLGPGGLFALADRCMACHNGLVTPDGLDVSIGSNWQASAMAHSSRDPYWQAAIRRETMDHPSATAVIEDECAVCHMPMSRFLAVGDGLRGVIFDHLPFAAASSATTGLAGAGVSCTVCHQIPGRGPGRAGELHRRLRHRPRDPARRAEGLRTLRRRSGPDDGHALGVPVRAGPRRPCAEL